jgi:hypothetical protein
MSSRALRRRLQRHAKLVRARSRAKNEYHALLARNLKGKPPMSEVFGKKERRWLAALELPADESETVACCLREVDFLDSEFALIERELAAQALGCEEIRRPMTVPGVSLVSAATFVAVVGDVRRFSSPRKLVSYVGLDPRVRPCADPRRRLRVRAAHADAPRAAGARAHGRGRPAQLAFRSRALDQRGSAREAEFARQVEAAHRWLVEDWQPGRAPRGGAGTTRGSASSRHVLGEETSARQGSAPRTCALALRRPHQERLSHKGKNASKALDFHPPLANQSGLSIPRGGMSSPDAHN